MLEVFPRFLCILSTIVTFPLNEVLFVWLYAPIIQDAFDFVFVFCGHVDFVLY